MTDQEINVAIAELCGWKQFQNACGDLNAMHEAEKTLTDEQFRQYIPALRWVSTNPPFTDRDRAAYSADARIKAEAFLRVHGKWKE